MKFDTYNSIMFQDFYPKTVAPVVEILHDGSEDEDRSANLSVLEIRAIIQVLFDASGTKKHHHMVTRLKIEDSGSPTLNDPNSCSKSQ
jgi:hypothetical protein